MGGLLLGIDIGTSGCKVTAFTREGRVAAHVSEGYPVHYPKPGHAEQDPEDWWGAVCRATRRLLEQTGAAEICGVGIDGQSWSAIPIDKTGAVLCPTPIWMDTRSIDQCGRMIQTCGEETLFRLSGNPVQPSYTLPKVLWYKDNLPQVYARADKILQSNSFIAYRLTGVCSQDHSQGYGWNCYDMAAGKWDAGVCQALGLRSGLLPPLYHSHEIVGRVTREAAGQTGLLEGTPVAAGGLDAACGALGVGVVQPRQAQEQGGQAGGMSICMDAPRADRRLILGAHVVPGTWLLQGGTAGGGGAVNWFSSQFGTAWETAARQKGTSSFAEMDAEAAQVPAGSGGVVFLPYLAGERSPIWDPDAKGVFYGFGFSSTRGHFARSVMEGVAFSLRHNLETAEEAGAKAPVLRSMGGAANSALWMQIKADVTRRTLEVPASDTATALGAAILAGVGVGMYDSFEQAAELTIKLKRTYRPDPGRGEAYDKNYQVYRALYERLRPVMDGREAK
ncbi:xylulokinase [Anaerofilum sp. BX8]|uniref:Xylulose kinase n=1 Tax=Anaerofilum hominis TaxID=2763016 RepID=A0A923KXK1_9FIRM|nr:xylulokinase [Anaerofilum hominis]MBC5580689.1 xylulokinase [Anaerofilum hominis]